MIAAENRRVWSGKQYEGLFPRASFKDHKVRDNGTVGHTIDLMKKMIPATSIDVRGVAMLMVGKSLRSTCRNIWEFVYRHIRYARDKQGIEQVRRPRRTWADRFEGVDCDCMTVFIGSILYELGIPFRIRITKYKGRSFYQHVYPIVPTGKGNYITLDCVVDSFDYEVPFTGHKDYELDDRIDLNGNNFRVDVGMNGMDGYALRETVMQEKGKGTYNEKMEKCRTGLPFFINRPSVKIVTNYNQIPPPSDEHQVFKRMPNNEGGALRVQREKIPTRTERVSTQKIINELDKFTDDAKEVSKEVKAMIKKRPDFFLKLLKGTLIGIGTYQLLKVLKIVDEARIKKIKEETKRKRNGTT